MYLVLVKVPLVEREERRTLVGDNTDGTTDEGTEGADGTTTDAREVDVNEVGRGISGVDAVNIFQTMARNCAASENVSRTQPVSIVGEMIVEMSCVCNSHWPKRRVNTVFPVCRCMKNQRASHIGHRLYCAFSNSIL